jgi:predicted secreted protein
VGDRIVLRLPENPTTGYRWDNEFPPFLRLRRDTNEHGDAPGAGGFRILELFAAAPGHEDISLSCKRPTDATSAPIDHFDFALEVS